MRILFCSQNPLVKELGSPRIMIELAEELKELGWSCKIATPLEIMPNQKRRKRFDITLFSENLKGYLLKHAPEYDVVEYDHIYLPYPRSEFYPKTLFVSRVTSFAYRLKNLPIPQTPGCKSRLRSLIMGRVDKMRLERILRSAEITLNQADLINIANCADKTELIRYAIPQDKIVVIPYGINRNRRPLFDAVSSEVPKEPEVVYIGRFDNYKGAHDFPVILEDICNEIPEVKLKLLGTDCDNRDILVRFPPKLRERIEIIPNFLSDDLPGLLSDSSVGIFPSYVEGFGFAVLEMLAASVPVIAYNTSGPPRMLPSEYLVPRGDTKSMSSKVVALLKDKVKLKSARIWAKERSQEFSWQRIAQETGRIYLEHCQKKQANNLKKSQLS